MFIDNYKILDVNSDASIEEIRFAFKKQAMKWHPDKNLNIDTTIQMQEINEAKLILLDDEARARYDVEYLKFQDFIIKKNQNFDGFETNSKYQEYTFEDDLLEKWIRNAKKQAAEIVKQSLEDFKGVSIAASKGCFEGVYTLVIFVFIINLLALLIYFFI